MWKSHRRKLIQVTYKNRFIPCVYTWVIHQLYMEVIHGKYNQAHEAQCHASYAQCVLNAAGKELDDHLGLEVDGPDAVSWCSVVLTPSSNVTYMVFLIPTLLPSTMPSCPLALGSTLIVMKINSMDSLFLFSPFPLHIWTYYFDPFLTDYPSYSHLLTNFIPRRGTKNNQTWDYSRSAKPNKSTVRSTSTEEPESSNSYRVGLATNHSTASRSASSASKIWT